MPHVLLLDDNADIVIMLKLALEGLGYEVTAGRTGREGLALLEKAYPPPDVILSNLYMPQMDGITFLMHVRQHPEWSLIPFVMMSAAPTQDKRQEALNYGADAFLVKPFKFDMLSATLNNLGVVPAGV